MASKPVGLGHRGGRLWREMATGSSWGPAELVLLEEACRLADRMDRFDEILRGDTHVWMSMDLADDGPVTVVLNSVISEARQHAVAYKQILAELRQGRKSGRGAGTGGTKARAGVADLTAKIAQRRAQAAS